MFLVKVIDQVFKNNRFSILSKDEVLDVIEGIVRYSFGWVKLVDNPQGKLLRMDKKVNFNKVIENIKKETE